MQVFEWAIDDVIGAHPHLHLDTHAAMAVLLMNGQPSPHDFLVELDGFHLPDLEDECEFVVRVTWSEKLLQIAKRIEQTEQRTPIVERAAVGITLLLFAHHLADSQVRVTQRKDRADYWLPKLNCALEISGTEHREEMNRRCREKRKQVLENQLGWDGYAVVCCFDSRHRVIQWHYLSQQEH